MRAKIQLGEIAISVERKAIKHLHLNVHPPAGRVTVSAPAHLSLEAIRAFTVVKLPWIRAQQRKIGGQAREGPCEYIAQESHHVWGRRYLLRVLAHAAPARVEYQHHRLILYCRPGMDAAQRGAVMERWYRDQLRREASPLIERWQRKLGVQVRGLFVQQMRTRWGSCNPERATIRLNTELAKKPRECLEYILVHELVHLREPTHNARFIALMDKALPGWSHRRERLNRLPVRHEHWDY